MQRPFGDGPVPTASHAAFVTQQLVTMPAEEVAVVKVVGSLLPAQALAGWFVPARKAPPGHVPHTVFALPAQALCMKEDGA